MDKFYTHYQNAKTFTKLLETQFKVGKRRFGLDPVLGLIPWGGDLASLFLSLYIIWIAIQLKIPSEKIALMMGNILFDFLIGLIPILGDIADFVYKANTRNLEILKEYIPEEVREAKVV